MTLLEECMAAHGGRERFAALKGLTLRLRCGGLALAAKGRGGVLADVRTQVDLCDPSVTFAGLGTWRAQDARPRGISRRLRWTDADVTHFAGYALWNYLAAPFAWAACEVRELPHRRLALTFPPGFPTHCRHQTAHLDGDGKIRRLDYTAEVFGPWARAQNTCLEYEGVGGVTFAVRRRVTPRGLPHGPTLVSVGIEELSLIDS